MASPSDLTTLAAAKLWLNLPAAGADDAVLSMMISQLSRDIISKTSRASILPRLFTETRDGHGKQAMMLRNYPVTSVVSVTIDGVAISAAPPLVPGTAIQDGYILTAADPEPPGKSQSILLRHKCFNHGIQNVVIVYNSGYQISGEPMTAPTTGDVVAQQPYGAWASDLGVVNSATGAALTKVAGVPTTGQYALDAKVVGGYVFAAADAGNNLLASYGFIPADLASACNEWVAERYRYRDRIGQNSKSIGGQETISFTAGKMSAQILSIIQQFTRVATF